MASETPHPPGGQLTDEEAMGSNSFSCLVETCIGTDPESLRVYEATFGAVLALKESLSANVIASIYAPYELSPYDVDKVCTLLHTFLVDYEPKNLNRPIRLLDTVKRDFLTKTAPLMYRLDLQKHHSQLSTLLLAIIHRDLSPDKVPILGYTEEEWEEWDPTDIGDIPLLDNKDVPAHLRYACQFICEHTTAVERENAGTAQVAFLHEVLLSKGRYVMEITASIGNVVNIGPLWSWPQENICEQSVETSLKPMASSMLSVAGFLEASLRNGEAMEIVQEAIYLYRSIVAITKDLKDTERLCHSLRLYARILFAIGRDADCLEISMEALDLARHISSKNEGDFDSTLSLLMRTAADCLGKNGRQSEALQLCKEAVAIQRRLVDKDPTKYESHLAGALHALADHYDKCKKSTKACNAVVEVVDIFKRLMEVRPSASIKCKLASALHNQAFFIANLGQFERAVQLGLESLAIRREMAEINPVKYNSPLGSCLHNLAVDCGYIQDTQSSIRFNEEAIAIRRKLVARDPVTFPETALAWSLNNLAADLDACGRTGESLDPSREATEIRRRLVATDPATIQPLLADSLLTHAQYLINMGIYDEAEKYGFDSISVRRELQANASDYLIAQSETADWTCHISTKFGSVGRYKQGLAFSQQAIDIYHQLQTTSTDNQWRRVERLAAQAYRNHGWFLAASGQYEAALEPIEMALQIFNRQIIGIATIAIATERFHPHQAESHPDTGNNMIGPVLSNGSEAEEQEIAPVSVFLTLADSGDQSMGLYKLVFGAIVTIREAISPNAIAAIYRPEGVTAKQIDRICTLLQPLLLGYKPRNLHQPIVLRRDSIRTYLTTEAPSPYRLDPEESQSLLSRLLLLVIKQDCNGTNIPLLGYTEGDWDILEIPNTPLLTKRDIPEHLWYACRYFVEHTLAVLANCREGPHTSLLHDIFQNLRPLLEASTSLGKLVDIVPLMKRTMDLTCMKSDSELASLKVLARSLRDVASFLEEAWRSEEALSIIPEAISIYRHIVSLTADPSDREQLALCLRLNCIALSSLHKHAECLATSQEGVGIARLLAEKDPDQFEATFAAMLRNVAYALSKNQMTEVAVQRTEEAVEIHRRLSEKDPKKYDVHLAASLHSLADHYDSCKRHDEALKTVQEAVGILRRVVEERPIAALRSRLATSLHNNAFFLDNKEFYHEALVLIHEGLEIRREIAGQNPTKSEYQADLAWSLHNLGANLGSRGRHREAIGHYEEANAIRRKLMATESVTYLEDELAWSLHNLAGDLSSCDRNAEALATGTEAIEIRRRLEAREPITYGSQLSDSLLLHSSLLEKLGRTEEAVKYDQEAISVLRRRASLAQGKEGHPFQSDIGSSCYHLARKLASCNRFDDARKTVEEAMDIYRRLMAMPDYPTDRVWNLESDLACCLRDHAWYLVALNEYESAVEPRQQSIETFLRLRARNFNETDYQTDITMLDLLEWVRKRRVQKLNLWETVGEQDCCQSVTRVGIRSNGSRGSDSGSVSMPRDQPKGTWLDKSSREGV
ncbi:TPR-like protein [Coprinopsis marcescibilis]|uniref:TPR-like protein n=1 Tax=Coprinopsis marcescibilis TaxID=230819 RepID=A0A5C3L0F9_COPMA|nr:TPR-like protein [Coprinopsis marcescibilis]